MKNVKEGFVICLATLVLLPAVVWAQASPHDLSNGVSCLSCHGLYTMNGVTQIHIPHSAEQESVCRSCHSPGGQAASMSRIGSHVVDGGTFIECSTCHNPHSYETSTDPHNGETAVNLKLVRAAFDLPGALSPVVF